MTRGLCRPTQSSNREVASRARSVSMAGANERTRARPAHAAQTATRTGRTAFLSLIPHAGFIVSTQDYIRRKRNRRRIAALFLRGSQSSALAPSSSPGTPMKVAKEAIRRSDVPAEALDAVPVRRNSCFVETFGSPAGLVSRPASPTPRRKQLERLNARHLRETVDAKPPPTATPRGIQYLDRARVIMGECKIRPCRPRSNPPRRCLSVLTSGP